MCFTILEMANDWHALLIPRRTMQLSIPTSANNWFSVASNRLPQSTILNHAHKSRPTLSVVWHPLKPLPGRL